MEDGIHRPGLAKSHRMRGNRLGLGHMSEMPGGAGCTGLEADDIDGFGIDRGV